MTCTATVQVTLVPGASEPAGQVTEPADGSLTETELSVVVPVFLTLSRQVTLSPRSILKSPLTSVLDAVLVSCTVEVCAIGVVAEAGLEVTGLPRGSLAPAVAVLVTEPASTSVWVTTCAPDVQVVDAPGESVVTGQATAPAVGSLIATLVTVVVPVSATRNDQVILSPRSVRPSAATSVTAAVLLSERAGAWVIGVSVEEGLDVTVVEPGAVAVAVAVLETMPASTSAWVIEYAAEVQVVVAPGASEVDGQVTDRALTSRTATPVTLTVPVSCTRNDQVIESPRSARPSPLTSPMAALLVRDRAAVWATGVSVEDGGEVIAAPLGLTAPAVAVLATKPASTSACVMVWGSAVQVVDAPGASDPAEQLTDPAVGSVTATDESVTVPVSLTRNDHRMVSPRSVLPSPLTSVATADLVSPRAGAWAMGVDVEELLDVIAAPLGFLPLAVAVLLTCPASTSAWVTVWVVVAEQVKLAPGASGVAGQDTAPAVGSLTANVRQGDGAGVLEQE